MEQRIIESMSGIWEARAEWPADPAKHKDGIIFFPAVPCLTGMGGAWKSGHSEIAWIRVEMDTHSLVHSEVFLQQPKMNPLEYALSPTFFFINITNFAIKNRNVNFWQSLENKNHFSEHSFQSKCVVLPLFRLPRRLICAGRILGWLWTWLNEWPPHHLSLHAVAILGSGKQWQWA